MKENVPESLIILHIKTLDESNFSINVPTLDITINDLKQLISKRISLPLERIRLIFRGRVCQNHELLQQCKIESNMTLHLVARCADMSISSPDYSSIRSPSDIPHYHATVDHSFSSSGGLSRTNSTIETSSGSSAISRRQNSNHTDPTSETVVSSVLNRSSSLPVSSSSSSSTSGGSTSTATAGGSSATISSSLLPTLPTRNYEHIYQVLHTLRTTLIATGWEITDNQNGTITGPVQETVNSTSSSSLTVSTTTVPIPTASSSSSSVDHTILPNISNTNISSISQAPSATMVTSNSVTPVSFQSSASLAAQGSLLLPSSSSPSNYLLSNDTALPSTALPQRSTLNVASRTRRYFVVGQWIDVLDTIEQWLEATIVRTDREFVLIHYNGWPQRWDEWLHVDSPRIAPFRTRSQHTTQPIAHCPLPVNILPHAPRVGPPPPLLNLPTLENLHTEAIHCLDADDIAVTVRLRPDDVRPALSRTSEAVYIMDKLLRTLTELTSEQPRREARRSALHSGAKASSVYYTSMLRTESKEDENDLSDSKVPDNNTLINTASSSSESVGDKGSSSFDTKRLSSSSIQPELTTSPITNYNNPGLLYAQAKASSSGSSVSPYRTYDSPNRRNGNQASSSPLAANTVSTRNVSFSPALTTSPGLADLDIASPVPVPSPLLTTTDGTKESKQDLLSSSSSKVFPDDNISISAMENIHNDRETFARAARVRDYQQGVEDRYEIEAVASQLAPMMDKIGRILIDLSPHIEALSRSPTFISAETTVQSNVIASPIASSSSETSNSNVNGMDTELESVQNALSRLRGQVSRVRADTFRLSNDVNRLLGEVRNVTVSPSSAMNNGGSPVHTNRSNGVEETESQTPNVSVPIVSVSPQNGERLTQGHRSPTIWRLPPTLSSSSGSSSRFTNPSAWLVSRYNMNRNIVFTNNSSSIIPSNDNSAANNVDRSSRSRSPPRRYIMTPAVRDAVVAGFTGLIRSPVNIITNEMNVLSVRQPGWGLATGDGSLSLIRDTEAGRRALAHSSLMQSLAFTALTNVLRSSREPPSRENSSGNPPSNSRIA